MILETDRIKIYGQNTDIDTAAEQLTATATPLKKGVWVKAPSTNTGNLYIGNNSSVTTSNGYLLEPGDREFFPCSSPSEIYCIGSAVNQVLTYFGI